MSRVYFIMMLVWCGCNLHKIYCHDICHSLLPPSAHPHPSPGRAPPLVTPTPCTTSRKGQYKIVPVLVGALKEEGEASYGQLFSKYLARPENLFVVSSDFCHWGEDEGEGACGCSACNMWKSVCVCSSYCISGKRFRYTLHNKSKASISASIRDLDHRGMGLIESLDPLGFSAYLEETQNTICGRRPISILLNVGFKGVEWRGRVGVGLMEENKREGRR